MKKAIKCNLPGDLKGNLIAPPDLGVETLIFPNVVFSAFTYPMCHHTVIVPVTAALRKKDV